MPSHALRRWTGTSAEELDEMVRAHEAVGGKERGRRYATKQLNHAYVLLLAAAFQRFCRDLHTESVNFLLGSLKPKPGIETVLLAIASHGRQLDSRNATAQAIAADFNPLGLRVLDDLKSRRASNAKRLASLEQMNTWRNAVAHQDFSRKQLIPAKLHLKTVGIWRRQCGILAVDLDGVMKQHLDDLVGSPPW